ncbi:MAG: rod shape-determining protein MreD [Proteocatella sp.]
MKNILYIFVGLLILILEISVANSYPIWGVNLDLLLIYVIILSKNTDAKSNFIVAVALGFFKDILIGLKFGVNIIILILVSALVRFTKDKIYEYRHIYPIILITIGTFIQCICYFAAANIWYSGAELSLFSVIFMKKLILNSILGIFVYESSCNIFDKI